MSSELKHIADVFRALGSEVRLKIIEMVSSTKRPLHIKGVARRLGLDYTATYRHVQVLRAARLVEVYEVGRSRVISVPKQQSIVKLIDIAKNIVKD
jgi:predicted transcriptional regulator